MMHCSVPATVTDEIGRFTRLNRGEKGSRTEKRRREKGTFYFFAAMIGLRGRPRGRRRVPSKEMEMIN